MQSLIFLFFTATALGNSPLVIVLMVKNEALVIKETLQPFVDGGASQFLIFDTGSTDNTQETAKEFFKDHNLSEAYVVEEPFIDFATSRNRALDVAEILFPEATFMLMPDAEWYIHGVEDLLSFCNEHIDDINDSYGLFIKNPAISFITVRLIRCKTGVRFAGVVHEAINRGNLKNVPESSYFEWRPSAKGMEKSRERWKRDRDLLLKEHLKNPSDPRTLFYLAQTYQCLDDLTNAYLYYEKRSKVQGWDEENFITLVRLGDVAQNIAKSENKDFYPIALDHYLEAFNLRPHRVEPLIKIAEYYLLQDKMHLAFLFAQYACKTPYPEKDSLFIEKYNYEFNRHEILSRCAWYIGEYEIGELAAHEALKYNPSLPYLHKNLQFYIDRKK